MIWAKLAAALLSLASKLFDWFRANQEREAGKAIQQAEQQKAELDEAAKAIKARNEALAKFDAANGLPDGKPDPNCRD